MWPFALLQVLLSIDDLVAGLHKAVEEVGQLNNTYFLYSSDQCVFATGTVYMALCCVVAEA